MKTRLLLLMMLVLVATAPMASPKDSVVATASTLKVTARAHNMGLFSYGGRLVTNNTVVDLQLNYTRRTWGFVFFKAVDLGDNHTPINFSLAAVNHAFHFGNKFTVTPHVGVILEQFESIADHGSDAVVIVTSAYKLNSHFTLEHTALAGNLLLEPELCDWVNRLRVLYTNGHLDVTAFGWHNNKVFDQNEYVSAGLSIFYSRLKLLPRWSMQAGMTGLWTAYGSEEQPTTQASGVFLTLGLTYAKP